MINSFTYDTDFGKITICEKDNFIIENQSSIFDELISDETEKNEEDKKDNI